MSRRPGPPCREAGAIQGRCAAGFSTLTEESDLVVSVSCSYASRRFGADRGIYRADPGRSLWMGSPLVVLHGHARRFGWPHRGGGARPSRCRGSAQAAVRVPRGGEPVLSYLALPAASPRARLKARELLYAGPGAGKGAPHRRCVAESWAPLNCSRAPSSCHFGAWGDEAVRSSRGSCRGRLHQTWASFSLRSWRLPSVHRVGCKRPLQVLAVCPAPGCS